MKGFCPSCEKESELTRIRRVEILNIKGEQIPVEVDFFVCEECGVEFDNPDPDYDYLKVAYEEYRRRKGMVQPEEIRAFREKYGLTQRELSALAGFGGATLSRYENGALQDEAHDTLLRLLMGPSDLLKVIEEKPHALSPEKRERIVQQLREEIEKARLRSLFDALPHYRQPSIWNGYRMVDIERLLNVVKRLCFRAKVPKTKLNKLLFYVDFFHYKNAGRSITGLCYVHLPLGPVPDGNNAILEHLQTIDPHITRTEEPVRDAIAEYFSCESEPEAGVLTYAEEQTVFQVAERFREFTAAQIVQFSHEEEGYCRTQQHELISYEFAKQLRI